jgi:hypothetical protein
VYIQTWEIKKVSDQFFLVWRPLPWNSRAETVLCRKGLTATQVAVSGGPETELKVQGLIRVQGRGEGKRDERVAKTVFISTSSILT